MTNEALALKAKQQLKAARGRLRALAYQGNDHACSLCGGRFSRWYRSRPGGRCPRCDAPARTRYLLHLARDAVRGHDAPVDVLHFAPEWWLRPHLEALVGSGYVTTDLERPDVDVQTSITALNFPDGRFDVIICSHVLEHIADDATAMRELFRTTRPGGVVIVQVPLDFEAKTDEDWSVTEPADRLRRWGHLGHVRRYGLDVVERLGAAGFQVEVLPPDQALGAHQAARQGLDRAVTALLCRRPSA